MDFTFSAEADDAAALAATILADHTKPERLAEVEAAGNRFDPVLWRALGDAGLLTLRARGAELERAFAFGVIRQLFDEVLRDESLQPDAETGSWG